MTNTAGDVDQYLPLEEQGTVDPAALLISNLPRIICTTKSSNEEVYQTGIMRASMEFVMKVDLDIGGYGQAKALFSSLLDGLQQIDLITQLKNTIDNNNHKLVYVNGLVPGNMRLNEVDNRLFIKIIDMDVIGYVPGAIGTYNQL